MPALALDISPILPLSMLEVTIVGQDEVPALSSVLASWLPQRNQVEGASEHAAEERPMAKVAILELSSGGNTTLPLALEGGILLQRGASLSATTTCRPEKRPCGSLQPGRDPRGTWGFPFSSSFLIHFFLANLGLSY